MLWIIVLLHNQSMLQLLGTDSWSDILLQDLVECETSLCVLFGEQWFSPWSSPIDVIFPFHIVESRTQTLIED